MKVKETEDTGCYRGGRGQIHWHISLKGETSKSVCAHMHKHVIIACKRSWERDGEMAQQ